MTGDIEHRRLTINGQPLHVAVSQPQRAPGEYVSNTRAQVLCIHGFPEGWLSWRPLMRLMPDVAFFAPDMRGYPRSAYPRHGYDVFTLMDDIDQLIERLDLERPILLTHDWGGALGWLYGHRSADRISQLVVVNCPHPATLVRAVFRLQDFQAFRIPWVLPFQVPWLPEHLIANPVGRKLLELSFTLREGSAGQMDRDLTREIVRRFHRAEDMRGAIEYYRYFVRTLLSRQGRQRLAELYNNPIPVPVTLVWGLEDGALSARVAQDSHRDAGAPVDWRPLPGIGHFVDLEAPELLARELERVLARRGQPIQAPAPGYQAA